ncbi:hypothetical protein [Solimicrobium silvestre]|uniref:Uncharacterized protein n=1 Tax=Solimicrobium silvestre TaxID=2099400 RepID=A0A2S9H2P6_9BURK|nr:hypothetical protein [Solimicrobium silvestre]PRC94213.1 hypothetical protein S2091_0834 [Solimicrobium silvestre]
MPCEGTAQFADCFIEEDNALLNSGDIHQKKSTLNVHEYSGGIQALVFNKHILKHLPSQSILGTVYSAHEIEITNFFKLMPNYIEEFGIGCSIENVTGTLSVGDKLLTDYEHEVCFLIMMNWDFKQITMRIHCHFTPLLLLQCSLFFTIS